MNVEIKTMPLLHSVPIVLLSVIDKGRRNVTTIGDVAVMGLNPPLIGFSTHENHLVTEMVDNTGKLTINIPRSEQIRIVDFCGIYSGREKDKSSLFNMIDEGDYSRIADCPINLQMRILKRIQIKQRIIYTGEVEKTYVDESLLNGESFDFSKFKALHYGLDNSYYETGGKIGTGYKEGKKTDFKV